ncbi:MAG: cytochrome P450 [Gemmataceae bacterium]
MATAAAPTLPPGPKGHFLTGNLGEFHKDVVGFYDKMANEYGDVVTFRLVNRRMILLSHPDLIEEVFVHKAKHFAKKTHVLHLLWPILGNGLLSSDGDFWLKQRRLMQPMFSRQQILNYVDSFVEYTQRMVTGWNNGNGIDLFQEMTRLTLEIISKALFDAEITDDANDIGDALTVMMHSFIARWGSVTPPLPLYIPTPANIRFARAIKRVDKLIYRFIDDRRASHEQRNDLLSVLLRARDEDGSQMTDKQLRDEAITLFLAGHETTANTLTFALYLLATHPEAMVKVQQEVDRVVGDRPVNAEDKQHLTYTESVIKEAMRLYPPAYVVGRVTKTECEIGGYRFPVGTTALMSQWVMHRKPEYWDEPDTFRPERWLDGSTDALHNFAYFPFGGGARLCIGNHFAMLESIMILVTIVKHVQGLELKEGFELTLRPVVTLKPEHGIPVIVRKN